MMENKIMEEMKEKLIKHFLDIIILFELKNSNCLSGYDILAFLHNRFGLLISSGTVYSLLYSLERKGMIEGSFGEGKRIYSLTDQGTKTINAVSRSKEGILKFMQTLFII